MRLRTESAREVSTIGTRAPSTSPAESAFDEINEIFGQHVAGFKIGHDQDLRSAGDRGIECL